MQGYFPEYWISFPLSDGKVQAMCKNRQRSFVGFLLNFAVLFASPTVN